MASETSLLPLNFSPGVVKDKTRYAAKAYWWDADLMRFVAGQPQSIGGWVRPWTDALEGVVRSLFAWSTFNGSQQMFVGTNAKAYVDAGGSIADITPIRKTTNPLANNSIASSNGNGIITVTDINHGAQIGDYVTISGATAFASLTTGQLNQEFVVLSIPTADTFTVDTGGTASSGTSGGGAAIVANYQIAVGTSSSIYGSGWGAGTWSRGTWGSAASTTTLSGQLRLWSSDNWQEDLVFNPRSGAIYHYDSSSPARAVEIGTQPGASDTPVVADQILVNTDSAQLLAFGTNAIGSSTADPMLIRWSDIEDYLNWTPSTTTSAGEIRLTLGTRFMCAVKTRQEILVFTDTALYSLRFTLSPSGAGDFSRVLVSPNISIAGPKAVTVLGDIVFWQGLRGFYMYNGQVQEIPCALKDYVFRRINLSQIWKTHAGPNSLYSEVWFFYPSADSEEIDSYVIYDTEINAFVPGYSLSRTAWIDRGTYALPRAADANSYIYDHETGSEDGSQAPAGAINSYIESSPVTIGDAKRAAFCRAFYPDVSFLDSSATAPTVDITLRFQNRAGSDFHNEPTGVAERQPLTISIEEFTEKIDIGRRGRLISFRYATGTKGTMWSVGAPEVELVSDGRR